MSRSSDDTTLLTIVRPAALGDREAIVDLWRSAGMLSELNDPREDLQFALQGTASTVLVAVDNGGSITGSIMVGHDGHRGNLYYVAVDPRHQRCGIGTLLVRAAERWLRNAGIRKIHVLVLDNNISVAPFYEKLGFGPAPAKLLRKWLVDRRKP
jgi:ribosomal protein S18 acetylase RimI-like enzyme